MAVKAENDCRGCSPSRTARPDRQKKPPSSSPPSPLLLHPASPSPPPPPHPAGHSLHPTATTSTAPPSSAPTPASSPSPLFLHPASRISSGASPRRAAAVPRPLRRPTGGRPARPRRLDALVKFPGSEGLSVVAILEVPGRWWLLSHSTLYRAAMRSGETVVLLWFVRPACAVSADEAAAAALRIGAVSVTPSA
ncbi:hypothetical protein ZWY2020_053917 [Hordeum vulgare]|nr:hypothetical protein ZWY2020_053917 [Hordeum vulgare]